VHLVVYGAGGRVLEGRLGHHHQEARNPSLVSPAGQGVCRSQAAEGKTWREAIRCLKRQLVRPVSRLLQEGQLGLQAAA
jgi:hypothetical protein